MTAAATVSGTIDGSTGRTHHTDHSERTALRPREAR